MLRPLVLPLLVSLALFAGCSDTYQEDEAASADGGSDAGVADVSPSPAAEAGPDAAPDVFAEAAVDAGPPTLAAVADVDLRDGAAVPVTVTVTRTDDAPVDVTLEGLPAKIVADPPKVTLGAGETAATFKLSLGVGVDPADVELTVRATGASGASTTTFTARVVAGGAPDLGFGAGGVIVLPGAVASVLGPDGSLFSIGAPGTGGCTIEKRDPDGAVDKRFGTDGLAATTGTIPTVTISRVKLGPQGDIVVGAQENSGGTARLLFFHFAAGGAFDATFGGTGFVAIDKPVGGSVYLRDLSLRSTGELLVAYAAYDSGGTKKARLAQFLANGQLDPSFTDPTPGDLDDYARLRGLPGGDVFAAGDSTTGDVVVMRPGATPQRSDSSWGHVFAVAFDLLPTADGGLFAVGFVSSAKTLMGSSFAAARYDANLNLVSPPSSAWSKRLGTNSSRSDAFYQGTIDARGRLLAVGTADYETLVLARFTDAGLDPSFGTGGIVTLLTSPSTYSANVAALPSGAIAVSAITSENASQRTRLLRLLP